MVSRPTLWDGEKPAYQIPTVLEIANLEGTNGFTLASLFAGGGGSSTGYRWAGYTVPYINEFLPAAQDTYRMNWPSTHIDGRDVRDVTGSELLSAAGVTELDVLDGSPPCKAFSMAGKRDENWGRNYEYADGISQQNDDLVFEFARLVDEVQPRMFVMENVKGLTIGVSKGYFKETYHRLQQAGYKVRAQLLDAQWLGVPQRRVRVFIIGVRNDLKGHPRFPDPLPYRYSMRDALPHLTRVDMNDNVKARIARGTWGGQSLDVDGPAGTITAGGMSGVNKDEVQVEHQRGGYGTDKLTSDDQAPTILAGGGRNRGQKITVRNGGYSTHDLNPAEPAPTVIATGGQGGNQKILIHDLPVSKTGWNGDDPAPNPAEPAPTVMAGGMGGVGIGQIGIRAHYDAGYLKNRTVTPDQPMDTISASGSPSGRLLLRDQEQQVRRFTIDEVRALCGFPSDYQLTGSYAQQWYRLGESVPPPMAKAVGQAVAGVLSEMS